MVSASVQGEAEDSSRASNKLENKIPLKCPRGIPWKAQQANFRTTAETVCLLQLARECRGPAGRSESLEQSNPCELWKLTRWGSLPCGYCWEQKRHCRDEGKKVRVKEEEGDVT